MRKKYREIIYLMSNVQKKEYLMFNYFKAHINRPNKLAEAQNLVQQQGATHHYQPIAIFNRNTKHFSLL